MEPSGRAPSGLAKMTPANDNDPMTGRQINNIREAAGMSVSELAAYLNMSVNTLRRKLRDRDTLGPDGVAKLEALERKLDAA